MGFRSTPTVVLERGVRPHRDDLAPRRRTSAGLLDRVDRGLLPRPRAVARTYSSNRTVIWPSSVVTSIAVGTTSCGQAGYPVGLWCAKSADALCLPTTFTVGDDTGADFVWRRSGAVDGDDGQHGAYGQPRAVVHRAAIQMPDRVHLPDSSAGDAAMAIGHDGVGNDGVAIGGPRVTQPDDDKHTDGDRRDDRSNNVAHPQRRQPLS